MSLVIPAVNLTNSFDKQEISDEMVKLAKFVKHHVPVEHEMDDPDFVDKRIRTLCQYGTTSALAVISKTESKNMKELIACVLNAFCKQADLRGLVMQVPLALEEKTRLPKLLLGSESAKIRPLPSPAKEAVRLPDQLPSC